MISYDGLGYICMKCDKNILNIFNDKYVGENSHQFLNEKYMRSSKIIKKSFMSLKNM
jgi:hypothetical protein